MSKDQWNSRYDAEEYIYGTQPNKFLKHVLEGRKPGSILLPAEGEGRNSVYAATLGWQVEAFDQSEVGREKSLRLAASEDVTINYTLSSLEEWQADGKHYDCIALIFVHLTPDVRAQIHQKMMAALNPGGILILEAFTRNQMPRTSGGPKNLQLLFEAEEIRSDFAGMEFIEFSETQVILDEGPLHQGLADVIRFLGRK